MGQFIFRLGETKNRPGGLLMRKAIRNLISSIVPTEEERQQERLRHQINLENWASFLWGLFFGVIICLILFWSKGCS